jgi:DNA-binding CsgD family transcriptional regulator
MESAAVSAFPLLERTEELARIESALSQACDGRGRFLVVEGPAGIGKTALLTATRNSAEGLGMRVLRARGAELEGDFAFGVVRQLFELPLAEVTVSERADLLQGSAGTAASLLGLPGAQTANGMRTRLEPDPSFAVLHGLYWLCANLAAQRPVCLVVDDAHWADTPSLRFLAFLLTRLDELHVALVVAVRPREPAADADLLGALVSDPSAETVQPGPLTPAAVQRFVEDALHTQVDPVFVDACLRATRGTPFLLRELLDALAEEGIAPDAAAARHVESIGARSVGRSIVQRLGRLPESAGRLARAVAILERGELFQAAQLAGLESGAAEAADLLARAGILEAGRPLTFVHPIVRTGIYTELSSHERAEGHRAAARLLAEQPGANERVAEHLLASDASADEWAVERLVDAARAASGSGAPETAAVFLRRAIAEPPASSERSGLLLELGVAEASAGVADWHTHLQQAVESADNDAAHVEAAMVLAVALSRAQRFPEAVAVLDRARSALRMPDAETVSLLEAAAVGIGMNDGASAPALSRRRAARELADADPSARPELLALAAFVSVLSNEPAQIGVELAIRGLAATERMDSQQWFSFATSFSQMTISLVWAERYDQARPLLDGSIAHARASSDSGRLGIGLAHRGWLALRQGDLLAAEADTRTALAASTLPPPILYRVLVAGVLVDALVEQGELDEAEDVLRPLDADAETASLTAAVLRFARGRLLLARHQTAAGLADLLAVGALTDRVRVICPSYLPWRSEAALAHLALGDEDAARRLADEELELARAFGAPRALGVSLRAVGVITGGRAGESLLREAVECFETARSPIERARVLTGLGALLRRGNRRTEARELLRDALDAAHRAGARPLSERAETELRATGARPRRVTLTGVDSLTASERRVAELAAQDLTNREIAQELFVTARTVEGHLTSVFRKLRVASREELADALGLALAASL